MISTAVVNIAGGEQPLVGGATAAGDDDNASRAYITMSDLLQDIGDDDGGGDGDQLIRCCLRMQSFLRTLLTVSTTTIFCLGI
jgi:hypothetical protein